MSVCNTFIEYFHSPIWLKAWIEALLEARSRKWILDNSFFSLQYSWECCLLEAVTYQRPPKKVNRNMLHFILPAKRANPSTDPYLLHRRHSKHTHWARCSRNKVCLHSRAGYHSDLHVWLPVEKCTVGYFNPLYVNYNKFRYMSLRTMSWLGAILL